jgi:hypothetical protein
MSKKISVSPKTNYEMSRGVENHLAPVGPESSDLPIFEQPILKDSPGPQI